MRRILPLSILACSLAVTFTPVAQASLIAAYTFGGTLAAVEPGVASLVAVDPLSQNAFQSLSVFGNTQNTYHFGGAASPPADQGGLTLDISGFGLGNSYSVEMVVELTGNSGWRRLLDSKDRLSDVGLYIDPGNNLDAFPSGGSSAPFSPNTFFDIFVTIDSGATITGYFSGVQQFTEASTSLNIDTHTLGFFLDNVASSGQGEWSSGNVALIKVFNTALSPTEVAAETADPFQQTATAPEPGTWMLMIFGLSAIAFTSFFKNFRVRITR